MAIVDQIREKYPFLTRKQREVADYMLEDPERMSYVTLKEMSRETGITEMTILKTCSILGFASFSGMKYEFRKFAAKQLDMIRHPHSEYNVPRTPAYELSDTDRLLKEICDEEAALNNAFFTHLDVRSLFAAADLMLNADKIILCGRGVSSYVCEYLGALLTVLGRGVIIVNTEIDDQIHAALPQITEKTSLFVVSFPDYYRMTTKMAAYAQKRGCRVILMSDGDKCPVQPSADLSLFVPTQTRMFLNSMGAPMMMANLIASAMNIRLSATARTFTEHKEEFYALFDEDDDVVEAGTDR